MRKNKEIRHLVVGYGEVGKAIHKVIGEASIVDLNHNTWDGEHVEVTHICVPFSKHFAGIINGYKEFSDLVIVHSSVPVGTCDELEVTHSPIRGVHPYLEEGIKTFPKYFGGKGSIKASKIFKNLGLRVKAFEKAKTTEALKLWDTTQYGRLIMLEKEIYYWCKKNGVDFNIVYSMANKDYNEGYVKLGRPEVVRPYLKHVEGKIGGHCIVPNAKLLKVKL